MRKSIFLFATLVGLLVAGCDKDNDDTTPPDTSANSTIADIVNNGYTRAGTSATGGSSSSSARIQFNFLKFALAQAGLTSELAREGNYTLFAPSDEAFRAAGFDSFEDLRNVPVETLKAILTYHVLGTEVLSTAVPAGPNAEVTMLSNQKAYVTSKSSGVFINGAKVETADINARNGVIHVIDRVLMPPVGTIVETAVANPDFSYLVAAVLRASEGSVDVAEVLSGAGPFTVFAPVNSAFVAAGFATTAEIMAADPATLTAILTYHVIEGRVFSSDLSDGMTPTMLSGGTTTITLSGGAKIKGSGNATASHIIQTDVVATNGVIHVIDGVLLP